MARPKKNENEKFNKNIQIRFTEEQYNKILEFIKNTSGEEKRDVSDFLRNTILDIVNGKKAKIKYILPTKYIYELNKIGVNLNQLTHKVNLETKKFEWENDKIRNVLLLIEKTILKISKQRVGEKE